MSSVTLNLIRKELRARRTSLIIYCLVGAASLWLYVSIFPSLQDQAEEIGKALNAMPKELLKAFGAEGTGLENVESLLATKHFGLVWPLLAIILMLNRAANALAGEIENNTLGTLLSQPLKRSRIFITKYLAGVITLGLFILCSVLAAIPIMSSYSLDYSLSYQLIFAGISTLFGLAVLGVGMAISAMVSERSRVYALAGGTVMVMFIINIISSLKPGLDSLKYTSVFYYFNAHDLLVKHHINRLSVLLFGLTAVIGFIVGLIAFKRRDIQI